jgi:biopolymer transport protein ExbD
MAFKPSRIKRHNTFPSKVSLNLTSMMDMFTIILVFLIKTYSTEGNLIQPSEQLTLPTSTIDNPAEVALDLVVSQQWIMVNDEPIMQVKEISNFRQIEILQPLKSALERYAADAKGMEEKFGIPFSGRVIIQGDKKLPFSTIAKVMATCGQSDYPNMRFLVYQVSKE